MRLINLVGNKFGRLTVISRSNEKGRRVKWFCSCECGGFKEIVADQLLSGKTKSCGCLNKESIASVNYSHGSCKTKEYKSWAHAKSRCFSKSNPKFHLYGMRGITMCDEWRNSFSSFIDSMGKAPDGCTLDRIDVNGNYEPSNCRWASIKTQANNTRRNVITTAFGFTGTLKQVSDNFNVDYKRFHYLINRNGYSAEEAINTIGSLI